MNVKHSYPNNQKLLCQRKELCVNIHGKHFSILWNNNAENIWNSANKNTYWRFALQLNLNVNYLEKLSLTKWVWLKLCKIVGHWGGSRGLYYSPFDREGFFFLIDSSKVDDRSTLLTTPYQFTAIQLSHTRKTVCNNNRVFIISSLLSW